MFCNRENQSRNHICSFHYCSGLFLYSLQLEDYLTSICSHQQAFSLLALAIGLIPTLRKLLVGNTDPLRVIEDSVSLFGEGTIPVLTLIIGGNLLKGLRSSGMHKSVIMGVLVVRYLLLPISGVLIVTGAHHFGLITTEPHYQFVLLLQYVIPPVQLLNSSGQEKANAL